MIWRVLIGSKSFGTSSPKHVARLRASGCEVIPNQLGRAYHACELSEALRGVHAIITGTDELTAEVIRGADALRTIAKHGVGLDTIDLAAARERRIVVSYTPSSMHDAVADHTLALLLALARGVVTADAQVRRGGWRVPPGIELRGKRLGLVGLGRIGREVATRALAFGLEVVAHDPFPDLDWMQAHAVSLLPLEELLETSDIVSLHAPADAAGVVLGAERLARMRAGALLINTSRGSLVDEDALVEALRAGRLAGAGLDVFVQEPPSGSALLSLENVVLTPHVAGQTQETLVRMGDLCVENVLRALRGERPYAVAGEAF